MTKASGLSILESIIAAGAGLILILIIVVAFRSAKIIEKSRNETRLSDLTSIYTALNLYLADNKNFTSLGNGIIYDSTADGKNAKKIDGTGWIPLNFASIVSGKPLSALPVDPLNDKAGGYYYRFGVKVTEKTFELDCAFETGSAADKSSTDGGNNLSRFEIGTDLSILN